MQHSGQAFAAAVAGLVLVVSATAAAQGRGNRDNRAEQIDRQTRTLALGASGSLELRNIVGDISVTAGSGRDVSLEIVRTSRGRTEADAKLGLERVTVAVDHRGERATVSTVYPEAQRPPYSVAVSYTVSAPAGTRVSVSSISGDVTIKGVTGDLTAQVTSGDIVVSGAGQLATLRTISGDVTVTDTDSGGGLTIGAMSGDVLVQGAKVRRINAEVTSGDVIVRGASAESAQLKSLNGDIEYAGTLAKAGRYELQSHSGDARLIVSGGAGFELQANTFNGSIAIPQGDANYRNVTTTRRTLRGTVGDGSAVVTITTFSGDVVVGKAVKK